MHLRVLAALLGLGAFLGSSDAQVVAKNYAGSPGFPTDDNWQALNATVNNRLVKCPSSGADAGACSRTQTPVYAIAAETAQDVVGGMKFASQHNLRVTVMNTGHDFLARNIGAGSLAIWTKNMKGVQWTSDWSPSTNSSAFHKRQAGAKQAAAIISAGMTWEAVQDEMSNHGQVVVTGADGSVGASGGWQQGGGHGPLSNHFGLGCDQPLEFEVATPTGQLVIANADSNPDLFWALRGGGGATYGVITKSTIKSYPKPTMNGIFINITAAPGKGTEEYLDAMSYYWAMTPNFTDFGISGYPGYTHKLYSGQLQAPNKKPEEIAAFINPIADHMRTLGATVTIVPRNDGPNARMMEVRDPMSAILRRHTRRQEDLGILGGVLAGVLGSHGMYGLMSSRLLARSKLNEANIPAIRQMLVGLTNGSFASLPYPNAGGQVARNRDLHVGVNPAWRDAVMHMIVMGNPNSAIAAMEPLSANSGAYMNEAYEHEKNVKLTFFGGEENYAKLLQVKQKWDPNNTLWCSQCVGYDVFTEENGKLYSTKP